MINYNIFSEINLNENFQTCTTMAPLEYYLNFYSSFFCICSIMVISEM